MPICPPNTSGPKKLRPRAAALPRGVRPLDRGTSARRGSAAWALLLALPLASAGGMALWSGSAGLSDAARETIPSAEVRRGPLEICLTERGQMESAHNTTLRHKVEFGGTLTILKIVEEGTWVHEGQVVVELDPSRFIKEAQRYQIYMFMYEAMRKTAEARLVIQRMKNESLVDTARHRLNMARLELQKYVEGDYVLKRDKLQGELQAAEENRNQAQSRLDFAERMFRKGYATTDELQADAFGVTKADLLLDRARVRFNTLEQYIHRRDVAQREANVAHYEREAARVELRAERELARCEVDVMYGKRWAAYFRKFYDNCQRQIAACTIRAPQEGVAVYANTPSSGGAFQPLIYEGAKVWEGMPLLHLPDVTQMQVTARIHESKVLLVREGQPVTIRVDAISGETFRGVVEKVAVAPCSASWPNLHLREYATVIRVADDPQKVALLRPGMTAEVMIHAAPLESVVQAPVQAVIERGGRHFAWTLDAEGTPHRRDVKVRVASSDALEIVGGLAEGEQVALDPRTDLPEEVAQLERDYPLGEQSSPVSAMESAPWERDETWMQWLGEPADADPHQPPAE